MAGPATTEGAAVEHPDLVAIGTAWLLRVTEYRRARGLYGKVGQSVITTDKGVELHLTEETTFRAPRGGGGCPLRAALDWIAERERDRKKSGSTGSVRMESDQQGGTVSWAKVFEVTVISVQRLDAARAG